MKDKLHEPHFLEELELLEIEEEWPDFHSHYNF